MSTDARSKTQSKKLRPVVHTPDIQQAFAPRFASTLVFLAMQRGGESSTLFRVYGQTE